MDWYLRQRSYRMTMLPVAAFLQEKAMLRQLGRDMRAVC